MNPQPFAVIELPATAPFSLEDKSDVEKILMLPNNLKLEAFTVRLAWGFASTIFLLLIISLLLAVAGYAGSIVAPDLEPQTLSSSWGK